MRHEVHTLVMEFLRILVEKQAKSAVSSSM